jgi:hypothetical protein
MEFIKQFKKEKGDFDVYDIHNLKELINAAIKHFDIQAKIDFDEESEGEYIELYNPEGEELLDKILELVVNDGRDCSVWYVYEGNLVRSY